MKLGKMIKESWKKLPVRLLIVVLFTVLPINMISIVVSGMVFYNSTRQIRDSYQRELDSGMTYFFKLLEDMDHYYDSFVTDYLEDLTLSSDAEGDNMACYEMLDSLKTTFDYANFDGVFYLYERKSGRVYFKYNSDRYNVNEVEAMKRKLAKLDEIPGSKKDWGIEHLGHYYFVSRTNKYTNYQIGLYIDLEQAMSGIFGQFASDGTKLYVNYKKICYGLQTERFLISRIRPGRMCLNKAGLKKMFSGIQQMAKQRLVLWFRGINILRERSFSIWF